MKVWTQSPAAKKAQNGVMEFLLINHPLDCPICDQGGECQLQDLAVGYGHSNSRYQEEKRVVIRKELGPLVAAEEMSRCIQCTRCVRFGQEIGGMMELGLAGRGENAEIVSFVGRAVESELSGNMIDLCPVGALTSEPFRYSARTWELSRRKSVSPHDAFGANLVVQVKQNRVMRVLPFENEAINECWLSDRDRFSYEGLNSADRLQRPMVKKASGWAELDWHEALDFVAAGLKNQDIAILASPHPTLEELLRASKKVAAPAEMVAAIAGFGEALKAGKNAAVLIGAWAEQHPQASQIHAAAQALGVKVGFIGEAANSVGGYIAGLPTGTVADVLKKKAIVVLGAEPALDCADPQAAMAALGAAQFVVQLSPWKTGLEYTHAILPIAPFTETAGTFVNTEGRVQHFYATVNPLGETRPGWKVLRVLGSLVGRREMEFDTIDEVRRACLDGKDVARLLSNQIGSAAGGARAASGIQRVADVPMYFADPLVRRSPPLQKTKEGQPPRAWMN